MSIQIYNYKFKKLNGRLKVKTYVRLVKHVRFTVLQMLQTKGVTLAKSNPTTLH